MKQLGIKVRRARNRTEPRTYFETKYFKIKPTSDLYSLLTTATTFVGNQYTEPGPEYNSLS